MFVFLKDPLPGHIKQHVGHHVIHSVERFLVLLFGGATIAGRDCALSLHAHSACRSVRALAGLSRNDRLIYFVDQINKCLKRRD